MENNNYWKKRAIQSLIETEKNSEQYIFRIQKMYTQSYRNVEKSINSIYKNYSKETGLSVEQLKKLLTLKETDKTWKMLKEKGLDKYVLDNYKSRISRLEQIKAQIYSQIKEIYPLEENEQKICYKGVINDNYYKTIYDVQMGTGYDFPFNKLDNNQINKLLDEKWSGKNYSERIWTNTELLANSVSEIVGGALLSGQSIEKTAKQIRDRFNVGRYYSERLVRTETNHFNNEADALAYEKMGIDRYVFIAVLDNRTSEVCQSLDKEVFETKKREVGVNYPPLHPNCRSTTRGYLGEEVERQLKRRSRNPITGETEHIDNMSYKDWAEKNGLIKPKTLKSNETHLKKSLGFYDDTGLTFIPLNSIITNNTIIAGNSVKSKFRGAEKYSMKYGGNDNDYSKVAGKIESDKYIFDIHYVKDNKGNEYDFKIKDRRLKNDRES